MRLNYTAKIQRLVRRRGVRFLLHFTQVANLPEIMQHGLLPRRELVKPLHTAYVSAEYRLDDDDNAISVSIDRLHGTFFSKRKSSGHSDWAVLALSPEILWTHECRFCWKNAARKEIKEHRGWMGGPWAFEQMFSEDLGTREGLPDSCPTDADAEVQVFNVIAPNHILAIAVNRSDLVSPVEQMLAQLVSSPPPVFEEEF